MNLDINRATEFHNKSKKMLGFIEKSTEGIQTNFLNFDKSAIEKDFYDLLGYFETLFQSLGNTAKKLDKI